MSNKILKLDQAQTLYSDLRERINALPTSEDIPEVPVQDVQVDGTSILDNGIASIPIAIMPNQYGLMKIPEGRGIGIGGAGSIQLTTASSANIKSGTEAYKPIVPKRQQEAVFYGLSKAAGTDLANEENITVGTYPASAKTAIQNMLDVPSNAAMTTAIGNAIGNINSFDMAVVQALPTEDISTHTIYLVPKTGETNDVYDEYVYINSNWEMVGNTQVDLSNYVQKTDYATSSEAGVVKVSGSYGLAMVNNTLATAGASSSVIKQGSDIFRPLIAGRQHESAFYGLAKAAGDTTQASSANAVGTYTTEAKAAIQTMLDTPSNADLALKANKTDTILETTLSRGRKANTTVGGASLAFGIDTEASGYYSVALGLNTTASSQGAFAEGKNTVAHYIAHAEGEDTQALGQWAHSQGVGTIANGAASFAGGDNTIANGHASFVTGRYNAADSYDNWPTWTANTSYEVGDRVKRNLMVQNEPTDVGYHCTVANSDSTFDIAHWELDGYHMNYVEIVGNGNEYEDPETHQMVRAGSNAYALEWNGTAHYAGDVYVNANADSSGGVKVATVNDVSIYATKADTVLETTLSRGRTEETIIGSGSFAFGFDVEASGNTSHAEGSMTKATNLASHAEGMYTNAAGLYSHAEGYGATGTLVINGEQNALTYQCNIVNRHVAVGSIIMPYDSEFTFEPKIIENVDYENFTITLSSTLGEAVSNLRVFYRSSVGANGTASHIEGASCIAVGSYSHAEGYNSQAIGDYSHAEGQNSQAINDYSHTEGSYTVAGPYAHAENYKTVANGAYSHVSGKFNVADGYSSLSEWTSGTSYLVGDRVKITAIENGREIIIGYQCKTANSDTTFTSKRWIKYPQLNYAEIIGNGTAENARSNAYALTWTGDGHYAGDVYVGANADSTGGTRLATVTELAAKLDAAEAGLKVVRLI